MKTIKVKKDEKTKEYFLDLKDFSDLFDISKIIYYELKENKKEVGFSLKFYDKNKKQIFPNKKV